MKQQRTLRKGVSISGPGGFSGGYAKVTILPADPNTGIVFDVNGVRIPALVPFRWFDPIYPRTTNLRRGSAVVRTTEHLLAALYGYGIDNALVVCPAGEVPWCDGSADIFTREFIRAGRKKQDGRHARKAVQVIQEATIVDEDWKISIAPAIKGELSLSASISFPDPIGSQSCSYSHSTHAFCQDISWARTFSTKPFSSAAETQRHLPGFELRRASNDYVESTMIVFDRERYITSVRRADEPVRHKVLDLIGDLALLGADIEGSITLSKAGHRAHHTLADAAWSARRTR